MKSCLLVYYELNPEKTASLCDSAFSLSEYTIDLFFHENKRIAYSSYYSHNRKH